MFIQFWQKGVFAIFFSARSFCQRDILSNDTKWLDSRGSKLDRFDDMR